MSHKVRILPGLAALFLATSSVASMSDRTISGEILDTGIAACGVRVTDGDMASLRPFIEATANVSGTLRLDITKKSKSGTSSSSQSLSFSGGNVGNSIFFVDSPAEISIRMNVDDADGKPLCRLDAITVLEGNEIRT